MDESSSKSIPGAVPGGEAPDVAGRVIAIIAKSKSLPVTEVTPARTFDDLQIDSLDKINLTFEIEEAFDIAIPDDSLSSLRTVGDVIAGVERLQELKPIAEPESL